MANIDRKGDTLVITIDVSEASRKRAMPSSTGKMLLVDSISQGVGDIKVQANIMIKNPAFVPEAKGTNKGKLASA